jgi:GMP synthase (glutamine-hydrolysing)
MSRPRILIVDGNVAAIRAQYQALLGYDTGTGYAHALRRLESQIECDIVYPADGQSALPTGVALERYDGAAITGSALCISDGGLPVERQIELARAVLEAGVPLFGSCWGLQVAVAAAGGVVRANPRGREFGFARRVLLSDAGCEHPLFAGKPEVFEAPTVHRDDIETLPSGAQTLATNDMGLQAAAFHYRRGTFWGVQYHPEYDYLDLSAVARRYGTALVGAGLFADGPALEIFIAEMRQLQEDPSNHPLLWKYGLGPAMRDEAMRRAELRNWLTAQVLPRHGQSKGEGGG